MADYARPVALQNGSVKRSSQWTFYGWGAKPIRPFAKEVAADLALVAFTSIATRTSSGTVWVLGPHHINTHLTYYVMSGYVRT